MGVLKKKVTGMALAAVMLASLLAGCGSSQQTAEKDENVELLVSAAASLTDVMQELADDYKESEPNVTLTYTFGSSGSLQTQIEEGAPADIFLSAGQKQMTALEDEGLLLDGTNKDLLENKIVLVVPASSSKSITSFEDLAGDSVTKIALGETASVPVGQYSEEVFTNLGIWDAVKAKTNFASDVRQVLTWVESGEVDCGVVYSTDAMTSDGVKIVAEAPEGSHKAIIYPAAVIKSSEHPDEAKAFLDYLSTDEAAAAFEKYGFTVR